VDPALTTHLGTSFRWRTAIRSVALPQRQSFPSVKTAGQCVVDPEPHRFGSLGSGYLSGMRIRIRIQEQKIDKLRIKPGFLSKRLLYRIYLGIFYDMLPTYVHAK
jgi:hypothetical protein